MSLPGSWEWGRPSGEASTSRPGPVFRAPGPPAAVSTHPTQQGLQPHRRRDQRPSSRSAFKPSSLLHGPHSGGTFSDESWDFCLCPQLGSAATPGEWREYCCRGGTADVPELSPAVKATRRVLHVIHMCVYTCVWFTKRQERRLNSDVYLCH